MLRSRFHGATDRVSDFSFRAMTWTFRVADFIFPKHDRLTAFAIRRGFTVVDYGCGPGRYIAEASRRVGPQGKVYAVDVHELAIAAVRKVIAEHNLTNVIPVLAKGYNSGLPDNAADLIYALDMFHGVKDPVALLAELRRIVKSGGSLILEDGHQSREKTRVKIAHSSLWRIASEEKTYVTCTPEKIFL
jgi:ubiquinone/menaquinone biosynthesis C-methylase UbiE